jgi:probable phosphoglycerate mutase
VDIIIVSRHGESVASARGLKNGLPGADAGLTAKGQDQARELARRIAADPIDLCVTSQFARTQQTAALALRGRGPDRSVDPNLNDVRYGSFEGQPNEPYHDWALRHSPATAVPGGESRLEVARRLCAALDAILSRPERCALVVTHELLLDDLLRAATGQPPARLHPSIPYATPYRLPAEDVRSAVQFLNHWITQERERSPHPAA